MTNVLVLFLLLPRNSCEETVGEEVLILARSLRELSIVEGKRGDRSIKRLVAWHP